MADFWLKTEVMGQFCVFLEGGSMSMSACDVTKVWFCGGGRQH